VVKSVRRSANKLFHADARELLSSTQGINQQLRTPDTVTERDREDGNGEDTEGGDQWRVKGERDILLVGEERGSEVHSKSAHEVPSGDLISARGALRREVDHEVDLLAANPLSHTALLFRGRLLQRDHWDAKVLKEIRGSRSASELVTHILQLLHRGREESAKSVVGAIVRKRTEERVGETHRSSPMEMRMNLSGWISGSLKVEARRDCRYASCTS
jgi:hypothetical protein